MRFADELRGSEGDECVVADVTGQNYFYGTILRWDDHKKVADVLLRNGRTVRRSFSEISLTGDETP